MDIDNEPRRRTSSEQVADARRLVSEAYGHPMTAPEPWVQRALAVACPLCGAMVGDPCVHPVYDDAPGTPHLARLTAASQQPAPEPVVLTDVEQVAEVLAAHRYRDVLGDYEIAPFYKHFGCSCGWEQNIAGMSGWWSWLDAHEAHVAEQIADRLAADRAAHDCRPWRDCTGAGDCPGPWHIHGCYADDGQCDDPKDHADTHPDRAAHEALRDAVGAFLATEADYCSRPLDALRAALAAAAPTPPQDAATEGGL